MFNGNKYSPVNFRSVSVLRFHCAAHVLPIHYAARFKRTLPQAEN